MKRKFKLSVVMNEYKQCVEEPLEFKRHVKFTMKEGKNDEKEGIEVSRYE